MDKIYKLVEFVKFTHEIRNIKRAILLESNENYENDSEHMYQLALVAWYLIENDDLKLDKYRCVGMAMVHDIVEVHAGDIPAYAPEYNHPSKAENEKKAAIKLSQQWPNFTSLHELINEYEVNKTPESHFVYALDKLIPIINNYVYDGRTWKEVGLDLEWVKKSKVGKIDMSPEINRYYHQLLKVLEQKPELFGSKNGR